MEACDHCLCMWTILTGRLQLSVFVSQSGAYGLFVYVDDIDRALTIIGFSGEYGAYCLFGHVDDIDQGRSAYINIDLLETLTSKVIWFCWSSRWDLQLNDTLQASSFSFSTQQYSGLSSCSKTPVNVTHPTSLPRRKAGSLSHEFPLAERSCKGCRIWSVMLLYRHRMGG